MLTDTVTAHQLATRRNLVVGIMINMHTRVLLPAAIHPVNKLLKDLFFLFLVMCPEIFKLEFSSIIKIGIAPQIFQAAFVQRKALDIKEHVLIRMRWQQGQAFDFIMIVFQNLEFRHLLADAVFLQACLFFEALIDKRVQAFYKRKIRVNQPLHGVDTRSVELLCL